MLRNQQYYTSKYKHRWLFRRWTDTGWVLSIDVSWRSWISLCRLKFPLTSSIHNLRDILQKDFLTSWCRGWLFLYLLSYTHMLRAPNCSQVHVLEFLAQIRAFGEPGMTQRLIRRQAEFGKAHDCRGDQGFYAVTDRVLRLTELSNRLTRSIETAAAELRESSSWK